MREIGGTVVCIFTVHLILLKQMVRFINCGQTNGSFHKLWSYVWLFYMKCSAVQFKMVFEHPY